MKNNFFIDEALIKIKAGNGGDGKLGFHREKFVSHGGPSGGNGGNGGSIFFVATINENTLINFKGKMEHKAKHGENGGLKNMTGAKGDDLYINVPIGTEILLDDKKIADLKYDGQVWLAAKGGRGGRGNLSFKSSNNTTPTLFEVGEKTPWINLKLNLKVVADVGIMGYPNAGKSTLITTITNSKSKVGSYEFTTLEPRLGVVKSESFNFVLADLPGLIDGASNDKGMGFKFLKHLSRTRIILHMIDASQEDYLNKYKSLRKELKIFSDELFDKKEIIVFSKIDLIDEKTINNIKKDFKDVKDLFFISSLNKLGLNELINYVYKEIEIFNKKEMEEVEKIDEYTVIKLEESEDELQIEKQDNIWTIYNKFTHFWANRIPIDSGENLLRIYKKLQKKGIIDSLKKKGINSGDYIVIKDSPFIYKF